MPEYDPLSLAEMTPADIIDSWQNLTPQTYHKTSDETIKYNCVSWALGKQDRWVDFYLTQDGGIDPDQSPKKYINLFAQHNFNKCDDSSKEEGFIKIAIYQDEHGNFTHVARQIINGNWTSKIGEFEDIEHNSLDAVAGKCYGKPIIFMKRPI